MMRRETLLILGHGVKGQGQLWYFVYKNLWARYRLQFYSDHLNFTWALLMMREGTLLIWGHAVKGHCQLWHFVYKTLCARHRLQFN